MAASIPGFQKISPRSYLYEPARQSAQETAASQPRQAPHSRHLSKYSGVQGAVSVVANRHGDGKIDGIIVQRPDRVNIFGPRHGHPRALPTKELTRSREDESDGLKRRKIADPHLLQRLG